jgi:hypothetical protein
MLLKGGPLFAAPLLLIRPLLFWCGLRACCAERAREGLVCAVCRGNACFRG